MGLIKFILKLIFIPIVLLAVVTVVIIFLIRMRREKKAEKRQLENNAFQPPPITQWEYPSYPQKPQPVVYPTGTPSQMERGIAHA
ncbi:uncharacterized protein N7498_000576 [Penicillium cinerascens]|uniref:Uncharacterized protein n=1 Tax=Penicillium cinerascens TaxID=70096 RepID=A0A9W9TD69_9EURO|nr:uncharacterized protein N7498_000576 [Penicillium cinerascens]KAJ5218477.1 hypothetical protein N7498_000576 [Penicillium cinerascens]